MGIPYWLQTPGAWNQLRLGNHVMPGLWDLDYDVKFVVDVAKAKNADGATVLDLGRDAIPLTLTGKLVSKSDWQALVPIVQEFAAKVAAKGAARGERVNYDIDHPKAKLIGLKKVYINVVTAPKLDRGVLTIVMRGVEVAPIIKEKKGKTNAAKKTNVRGTADINIEDQKYLTAPDGTANGPFQSSLDDNQSFQPPGP